MVTERFKQWDELAISPFGLEGYLDARSAVVVHLSWRLAEGPRLDVSLGFCRAPGRVRFKANVRRKLWSDGVILRGRYEMQLPVLVDVVKGVEVREGRAGVLPAIIPSYVWLNVHDRPPVAPAEVFDARKVAGFVANRKHHGLRDLSGEASAKPPEVQLVRKMVERGAKVEHDLASPQEPVRVDARQLAEIEAVLKSVPVWFGPNGPCFAWRPEGFDLLLEYYEMAVSSRELGEWPFEAASHPLPMRS